MTINRKAGLQFAGAALRFLLISFVIYFLYLSISTAVNRSIFLYNQTYNLPEGISLKDRERHLQCLAQNIYYEAGYEPFEGKVAVAQVTLNRMESGKFPDDVCGVVYQKNAIYGNTICQFSWYCSQPALRKPTNPVAFNESMAVAKKVLLEGFRLDGLKDAMYYHADYVSPKWGKEKIATIGRHIFYSDNKAKN